MKTFWGGGSQILDLSIVPPLLCALIQDLGPCLIDPFLCRQILCSHVFSGARQRFKVSFAVSAAHQLGTGFPYGLAHMWGNVGLNDETHSAVIAAVGL